MPEASSTAVALADATRVCIIDALVAGPRRTSELAGAAGMSASAVSRHLKVLRDAQVVDRIDVDHDGRGRAYRLRPGTLEDLASWIHSATWSAELADGFTEPATRELLGRVGGFLDAFGDGDVAFFERHLRDDVALIFPEMAASIDKADCIDSVGSHSLYKRHEVVSEPVVRHLGPRTTMITLVARVRTAIDFSDKAMFITALFDESDPWQLLHLQWTPAADRRN